jgi:hypothetical protein
MWCFSTWRLSFGREAGLSLAFRDIHS